MSQTDAQVLELYKLARDTIATSLSTGSKQVIELEIRNRRVEYAPTFENLELLERLITLYSRKTSTAGPSRNYARLKR